MACDLDRRCRQQVKDLEARIARYDRFIDSRRKQRLTNASLDRTQRVLKERTYLIEELHDMKRAHDAYDRALDQARSDDTGQDLERFYEHNCDYDEPIRHEY